MDSKPASLEGSESFYQYLFDSTPDLLMTINRDGKILIANSRCKDVLGHSQGDLEGRLIHDQLSAESRSEFEMLLRGVLEGTHMPEVEVDVIPREGRDIPMMLGMRLIQGQDPKSFMVRLRDLREIKVLEQQYRGLFESIADAIFIGDPESGQIYQANQRASELTGFSLGELMSLEYDSVHSESWEVVDQERRKQDRGELTGYEMQVHGKDGSEIPVEIQLRVVPRGEDQIFIESVLDISARKALEARMKELRNDWDSFIRHELRAPLTPILQDFQDVVTDEKVQKYLDAIWRGGKRLENLLNLTREVQDYERGQIPLQPLKHDLYETLKEAIQEAELSQDVERSEGRVKLIPHETAEATSALYCKYDIQKIHRVVSNLVKNALEHDPGEVTVRVLDEGKMVSVGVHNWGPPISEDRLKTIFEKFNTTKRDKKGTGLGTTIARLFIEAHGGRIGVTSSEEDGTTFTASLPKQTKKPAEPFAESSEHE